VGPPLKPLEVPDFSNLEQLDEKEYQYDINMLLSVPTLKELNIDEEKECGI
jgi:hypothetical protein